jgi:hypothetical protein
LALQRQFGRGEYVPHHVGATEVGVATIAAVLGQCQFAAGEVAYRLHLVQLAFSRGSLAGSCNSASIGVAGTHHGQVPADRLRVVAGVAAAKQQGCQQWQQEQ